MSHHATEKVIICRIHEKYAKFMRNMYVNLTTFACLFVGRDAVPALQKMNQPKVVVSVGPVVMTVPEE